MKNRNGYLLLEGISSLSIIATIKLVLGSLLIVCMNIKVRIEDKVELQQQGLEITKHIKSTIEKSKGIISIQFNDIDEINEDNDCFVSVNSIKCRYKNEYENITSLNKNKEISFKKNLNKLFINTLNLNNQSEPGGYEIGNYVDCIYVEKNINDKFVKIKLKLSKNSEVYETNFKVYIRNLQEEI